MHATHRALTGILLASTACAAGMTAARAQSQDTRPDQAAGPVEEIIVSGEYIPDEKRATSEISNLLDAEDFVITGDSNAAEALRRVTGLSLVGDGFVYVRGLGERYSKALLNGAELPSPQPLQRVVPLDIFPASFLSGVLVQKTYSPQYPSEFGGGVIELRTAVAPDEGFVSIGASVEYDAESTGKDGLSYRGGNFDILGFDDGFRELPNILANQNIRETNLLSPEQLEFAAESLPRVFSLDSEPNAPNVGVNLSLGDRFEFGDGRALGILAAVDYDSSFQNRTGQRNTVTIDNVPDLADEFRPEACRGVAGAGDDCGFRSTQWDIDLNGILSLGLELGNDHRLKFDTLVLRKSTREGVIEKGKVVSEDEIRTRTRLDWVEQQTWINQGSGTHYLRLFDTGSLEETELEWHLSWSEARRKAPLRRRTEYERSTLAGGEIAFLLDTDQAETSWSALDDTIFDAGIDITQPMTLFDTVVDLKFGFSYFQKERVAAARSYRFDFPGGFDRNILRLIPELIFTPDSIRPDNITLIETSTPSDVFDGEIENYQGYASLDVQITDTLRIAAGFRAENIAFRVNNFFRSTPIVDPRNLPANVTLINPDGGSLEPGDLIRTRLEQDSLLPAATLTWEFARNMQIRAAFSQTLGRPSLRELSFAEFIDPERDAPVFGNPTLDVTEIDNFDLRWEWYFGAGEFITLGVFYKDISNPIERSFVFDADQVTRTFINGDTAELIGVEAEVEKNVPLSDWIAGEWLQSKEFFVKANGAFIDSETTVDPTRTLATNDRRRLQGQSEFLANVQLGWEDYDIGERAAVIFNFTGKRIQDVGLDGAPDVFEDPPESLDIAYSRDFEIGGGLYSVSVQASNLLGQDFALRQGGLIVEQFDIGRTIQIGVKATY